MNCEDCNEHKSVLLHMFEAGTDAAIWGTVEQWERHIREEHPVVSLRPPPNWPWKDTWRQLSNDPPFPQELIDHLREMKRGES